MGRTLVASPEGVKLARNALKARNLTQTDFAMEVGLGYTTVNNFLNSKPIYRTNFQEICVFLDLDWRDIAVFGEAEPQELTPLDNLWQQLQLLSSPTEQMGLVLVKEDTLVHCGVSLDRAIQPALSILRNNVFYAVRSLLHCWAR